MSEYETSNTGWPDWAKLALFCAALPFIVLAIAFGYFWSLWVVGGPYIVARTWIERHTSEIGLSKRPVIFWCTVVGQSGLTLRGFWELYQKLTEVPL